MKNRIIVLSILILIFSLMLFSCDTEKELDELTVTFNSNGGESVENQKVEIGGYIEEPFEPSKDGYTFEGWYNGDKKWDFSGKISNDITLTAKWSIIEYSITYGDGLYSLGKYTVEDELCIDELAVISSKPYESIVGWYLDRELTNELTKIEKGTTGDIALYAKTEYTPILYRVSSDKEYMIVTGCHKDATEITIPSTFGNRPVLAIDKNAFYYNNRLQSIIIENGITEIGELAFAGTTIESITLPSSLKAIGRSAFANAKIKSIDIPDSVELLGDGAFKNCSLLETVRFGKGVSIIPSSLFESCSALKAVHLNGNIAAIYQDAFRYCVLLKEINLGGNNIERIENSAFWGCASLKAIVIPSSVAYIGRNAFGFNSDDEGSLTIYCELKSAPSSWSPYWHGARCNVIFLLGDDVAPEIDRLPPDDNVNLEEDE